MIIYKILVVYKVTMSIGGWNLSDMAVVLIKLGLKITQICVFYNIEKSNHNYILFGPCLEGRGCMKSVSLVT